MRDPFFDQMPQFFGISFQQLMKAKHPTAWIEFETGSIDESELFRKFFLDGSQFDGDALRKCMVSRGGVCAWTLHAVEFDELAISEPERGQSHAFLSLNHSHRVQSLTFLASPHRLIHMITLRE